MKKKGYWPSDSIGQSGIERTYDTYLRGKDGTAQLTVDSRGRPKSAGATQAAVDARRDAAPDARHQSPARGREGAHVRHRARARERRGRVRRRRRDRRDRPAQRRRSSRWRRTRRTSRRSSSGRKDLKKLAPLLNPTVAAKDNFPALNRAIQVGYPPGSTFKPVTALAAMQEHLLTPFTPLHCTPSYTDVRPDVPQLDAGHRSVDGPAHGARRVVRHVLLPARRRLLPAAAEPRPPVAGVGEPVRARRDDRRRHRRRDRRADPDAGVAVQAVRRPAVQGLRRPDLEAGLLDPARDRPGRRARDAAPDDAVLRADRERREARDAAPRRGRRAERQRRPAAARAPPLRCAAAAAGERRSDRAAVRAARSRGGDARVDRHLVGRVRELQGRHRRQDGLGREVRARDGLAERDQAEPVLVVRVRPVRRADDRRLRR